VASKFGWLSRLVDLLPKHVDIFRYFFSHVLEFRYLSYGGALAQTYFEHIINHPHGLGWLESHRWPHSNEWTSRSRMEIEELAVKWFGVEGSVIRASFDCIMSFHDNSPTDLNELKVTASDLWDRKIILEATRDRLRANEPHDRVALDGYSVPVTSLQRANFFSSFRLQFNQQLQEEAKEIHSEWMRESGAPAPAAASDAASNLNSNSKEEEDEWEQDDDAIMN
jgi:hypothetical protein